MADEQKKYAPAKDVGQAEVQASFDEAEAKGYFGEVPDPTPNEHYTVAGVTSGKPTPETDPKLAKEVGSTKFLHREGS